MGVLAAELEPDLSTEGDRVEVLLLEVLEVLGFVETVEGVGIQVQTAQREIHARAQGVEWIIEPHAVEVADAYSHTAVEEVAKKRTG